MFYSYGDYLGLYTKYKGEREAYHAMWGHENSKDDEKVVKDFLILFFKQADAREWFNHQYDGIMSCPMGEIDTIIDSIIFLKDAGWTFKSSEEDFTLVSPEGEIFRS